MRMRAVVIAICVLGSACGGASSQTQSQSAQPRANAPEPRGETLSQLLAPRGASLPREQLERIAAFIRRWEEDPYADMPENDTEHSTMFLLLSWVSASPDVRVLVCGVLSSLIERSGRASAGVAPVITPGEMFGMAAYLIERPDADPASAEVQVEGVRSALRWYDAALDRGQIERDPLIDEVLARRGELGAWYQESRIVCGTGGQ